MGKSMSIVMFMAFMLSAKATHATLTCKVVGDEISCATESERWSGQIPAATETTTSSVDGGTIIGVSLVALALVLSVLGIICLCWQCRERQEARERREEEARQYALNEARARREAQETEERRLKRCRLEDELMAAQRAYQRDGSTANEDRLTRAHTALARHDGTFVMPEATVTVQVNHGYGFVPGSPFFGGQPYPSATTRTEPPGLPPTPVSPPAPVPVHQPPAQPPPAPRSTDPGVRPNPDEMRASGRQLDKLGHVLREKLGLKTPEAQDAWILQRLGITSFSKATDEQLSRQKVSQLIDDLLTGKIKPVGESAAAEDAAKKAASGVVVTGAPPRPPAAPPSATTADPKLSKAEAEAKAKAKARARAEARAEARARALAAGKGEGESK